MGRPSFTAEVVCWSRCVGNHLGTMSDPFAAHFLEWDARFLAWLFAKTAQALSWDVKNLSMSSSMFIRTLAIDNFISAFDANGPKQLVILGAGLDARPYRMRLRPDTTVFEVDAPATQRHKRELVDRARRNHPELFGNKSPVHFVAVNFATESFMSKLLDAGFNPNEASTVFVLEGVTGYLPWEAVRETLESVSHGVPSGVGFAATFVRNLTDGTVKRFSRFLSVIGEPRKFGLKPGESVADVVEPLGYKVESVVSLSLPKVDKGPDMARSIVTLMRVVNKKR